MKLVFAFLLLFTSVSYAGVKNKRYPGRHLASIGQIPDCTNARIAGGKKWSLLTYGYNVESDVTKLANAQELSRYLSSFSRITGFYLSFCSQPIAQIDQGAADANIT